MNKNIQVKNNLLFNRMTRLGILLVFSTLVPGCSGFSEKKSIDQTDPVSRNKTISKPPSSYMDSLIITSAGAVIFKADSLQQEGFKAINKKMVFESMVHECFYQMKYSGRVLKKDWPQLKIIESSRARYLVFLKADKSRTVIDLNTKNNMCGLFLFDGKKDPELADMTNLETALRFYFEE